MNLLGFLCLCFLSLVLMLATWGTMLRGVFVLLFFVLSVVTGAKAYFNTTT